VNVENSITFGTRLKRLRVSRGMSVAELAQASDTPEATIRALEKKTSTMPELFIGLKIAEALRVDPYFLALGDVAEIVARLEDLDRRVRAIERQSPRT
jgi:transcriptional regulator with XRE-family HTH domain